MAFDPARRVTVMFGSLVYPLVPDGSTWEYDASLWTLRSTTGPSPRSSHSMAYDLMRGKTMLFGGYDIQSYEYNAETWAWDGSSWTQLSSGGLSARAEHAMAYDTARRQMVLFGGRSDGWPCNDTWVYDTLHIMLSPASVAVTAGQPAQFVVQAAGGATYDYQWWKNGVLLCDDGRITGARAATLTIANTNLSDAGTYQVTVYDEPGNRITTAPTTLTVLTLCLGDMDCNGQVDFGDINPFVFCLSNQSAWQAAYPGCPAQNGDIDGSGAVGFDDINPFVTLLSTPPFPHICEY